MKDDASNKKISNARFALLIAIIPVALFIAAFFIHI